MKLIDYLLDRITMYRLVLYYLIGLVLSAMALSLLGRLHYPALAIALSAGYLTVVCLISNWVFGRVFKAPVNVESAYITALILTLILTPLRIPHDVLFLGWAGTLAMASKYILAFRKKHIFNPAAIAAVLVAFVLAQSATWWVGTAAMLPAVIIGGLLLVRKLRRFDLVLAFLTASLLTIIAFGVFKHADLAQSLHQVLLQSPLFFFAFVMLTEPLTLPPTATGIIWYGALVGALFAPQVHIGHLYSTPELALIVGNGLAFALSPKYKLLPRLTQKIKIAPDIADFVFEPGRQLDFKPGQYMEFTLPHDHSDSRGNRRYFTLANSPTEAQLRIGVKFYPKGSSYKQAMLGLSDRSLIGAGQLAGDFVMPDDTEQKLAFMAGGIGITPYRSMLKYLLDTGQQRSVALFYSVRTRDEFVYQDVLAAAQQRLGVKVVYTLTDANVPAGWQGHQGFINADLIKQELPDYQERLFYVSGSHQFVTGVKDALHHLGVSHSHIKTDFFPGYA